MDTNELQVITIECVKKLQNINLRIIAEVTDMGIDYQRAAKTLGVTEECPYYVVNEQKNILFL